MVKFKKFFKKFVKYLKFKNVVKINKMHLSNSNCNFNQYLHFENAVSNIADISKCEKCQSFAALLRCNRRKSKQKVKFTNLRGKFWVIFTKKLKFSNRVLKYLQKCLKIRTEFPEICRWVRWTNTLEGFSMGFFTLGTFTFCHGSDAIRRCSAP